MTMVVAYTRRDFLLGMASVLTLAAVGEGSGETEQVGQLQRVQDLIGYLSTTNIRKKGAEPTVYRRIGPLTHIDTVIGNWMHTGSLELRTPDRAVAFSYNMDSSDVVVSSSDWRNPEQGMHWSIIDGGKPEEIFVLDADSRGSIESRKIVTRPALDGRVDKAEWTTQRRHTSWPDERITIEESGRYGWRTTPRQGSDDRLDSILLPESMKAYWIHSAQEVYEETTQRIWTALPPSLRSHPAGR